MKWIKKYTEIGIVLLFVVVTTYLCYTINSNRKLQAKWKQAVENNKAYSAQYDASQKENRAFKLTIEELRQSNDSIFQAMNAVKKELKIKDSKLRSIQNISSDFSRVDTIRLPGDTIFKDNNFSIDTLLSDEWYSLRVGLKYPSEVIIKPKFKSEKYIMVSAKRETVNPPKKFFLLRWLQKHHWVVGVDVVEKNPYVQNQDGRYVEIVR